MTTTKDGHSIEAREKDRARIAKQTAEFEAKGGKIVKYGVTRRD